MRFFDYVINSEVRENCTTPDFPSGNALSAIPAGDANAAGAVGSSIGQVLSAITYTQALHMWVLI